MTSPVLARYARVVAALAATCGATVSASPILGIAQTADRRAVPPYSELLLDHPGRVRLADPAPAGDAVAFAQERRLRQTLPAYGDVPVSDVWVAVAPTWKPSRIARPRGKAPPYFDYPQWSPSGQALAFIRRRGQQTELVVWSRLRKTVTYTSPCVLLPLFQADGAWRPFYWLDATRIVVLARHERCSAADASVWDEEDVGEAAAMRAWQIRTRDRRAAVSVLEAGVPPSPDDLPQESVWLYDVVHRRAHIIARGPFESMLVAPGGTDVALLAVTDIRTPRPGVSWPHQYSHFRYGVTLVPTFDTGRPISLSRPGRFALAGSVRWAPNARRIAFVEIEKDRERASAVCAVSYDARNGAEIDRLCGHLGTSEVRATGERQAASDWEREEPAQHAVAWTGSGHLVVRLCSADSVAAGDHEGRCDWYATRTHGPPVNLTGALQNVPDTFFVAAHRTVFVGAGELWEMRDDSTPNVTHAYSVSDVHDELRGSVVALHSVVAIGRDVRADAVLNQGSRVWSEYIMLHAAGVDILPVVPIPHTRSGAWVYESHVASHRAHATILSLARDSTDGYAVAVQPGGSTRVRVLTWTPGPANPAVFRVRPIRYQSAPGDSLQGEVTLPAKYALGARYPLIVIGYPGSVTQPGEAAAEHMDRLSSDNPLVNPTVYAAHGFVVLRASMPYAGPNTTSRGLAQLADGVLPAIDAVVRLGIADSARVGYFGHSFGGFGVYALLTVTHRFRAAVAAAGPADFFAWYGTYSPPTRYGASSHYVDGSALSDAETGQVQLGGGPWERAAAYAQYSPLLAADKIDTPLMIVQGDQDVVPIEQGEQMFSALYRQGKRAEFVRYWGEGHVIAGYYNKIDLEQRVTRWFATYLGVPDSVRGGLP